MENIKNSENSNNFTDEVDSSISKVNIDKYKDLDGLTLKKLGFGLWYLENKSNLLKALYIFLGLVGFITWSLFFYTFGHYVLIGMNEDEKIISDMVNNPGIVHQSVLQTAARHIQIDSADVITNTNGTYDLVAKISNLNKRFYSVFTYTVNVNNETLGPFEDYILPFEEKYLIILDQDFSRRPSSVSFEIENSWSRLDGHAIDDWQKYKNDYIDFVIDNKVFSNPKDSNLSEKLNLSVVEFDILNKSPYSYYKIDLDILLYSNQKLVSVSKYPIERLISGEKRHINITWPGKVVRADSILVIPNINIMRNDIVFIP